MKKFFLLIIIPLALFICGLAASLYLNTISFSNLSYPHYFISDKSNTEFSLNPGRQIRGRFTANEDNLGIITLKLTKGTSARFYGSDYLSFRIRRVGDNDWFHTSKLLISKYEKTWTLPIGFPIIENSKKMQYEFVIESFSELGDLSINITGKNPKFYSVYKVNLSENLNVAFFGSFLVKKIYLSFSNPDFLFSSAIYFAPFIAYTVAILINRRLGLRLGLPYVVLLLIALDIFIISSLYPGLPILLLVVWCVTVIYNKLESNITFSVALLIFIILLALTILKYKSGQDASAFYLYGFLIIGTLFALLEEKGRKGKMVKMLSFLTLHTKGTEKGNNFSYGDVLGSATQLFRTDLYKRIGISKMIKGKKVLDLGCGYGVESVNFAKNAHIVVGSDIEEHNSWKHFRSKKLEFVKANSEKLPMKNNEFDVVYLKDLLHHVGHPEKTLSEINRVSKSDAYVIIIEGNRYNPIFFFHATLLNGHNHFTQKQFREMVGNQFPNANFLTLEAYPPYILNVFFYKVVLRIEKLIEKIKFLSLFFSYNVAVIRKR